MIGLCLITLLLPLHKPKTLSSNNHNCTDFFSLQGSLEPALIFLGNPLAQFFFPFVNRFFTYSNSYCHTRSLSLSCSGAPQICICRTYCLETGLHYDFMPVFVSGLTQGCVCCDQKYRARDHKETLI